MKAPATALVIIGAMLASSCASVPGDSAGTRSFVAAQKQQAAVLEEQGRLAESLAVWRSLVPLGADAQTKSAIKGLENRIGEAVREHLANAKKLSSAGNTPDADIAMLRVLALQPGNKEALKHLRKSASKRAQAQARQTKQSDTKYAVDKKPSRPAAAAASGQPTKGASTKQSLQALYDSAQYQRLIDVAKHGDHSANNASLVRKAHVKLANAAEQAGKVADALAHLQAAMIAMPVTQDPLVERSLTMRATLSDQWYQEGARLMKSNLEEAIEALQQSLQFNPYNKRAKSKLAQAETMRKNLEKISGGNDT